MNENKSKKLLFFSVIIIILVIVFTAMGVMKIIDNNKTAQYSKQLNTAIQNDDLEVAKDIIDQCPNCVNSLPTIMPYLIRYLWDYPAQLYPLQEACYGENYSMVQLLIENGANVNCAGQRIWESDPPLTMIVRAHLPWLEEPKPIDETDLKIIRLLLENGADKTIKDCHGKTAYDYAVELNDPDLEKLLKIYYVIEDFKSISIGDSSFKDVYEIAPSNSIQITSYGGFCEYPTENGGFIRIKFQGEDLIVISIEKEAADSAN